MFKPHMIKSMMKTEDNIPPWICVITMEEKPHPRKSLGDNYKVNQPLTPLDMYHGYVINVINLSR